MAVGNAAGGAVGGGTSQVGSSSSSPAAGSSWLMACIMPLRRASIDCRPAGRGGLGSGGGEDMVATVFGAPGESAPAPRSAEAVAAVDAAAAAHAVGLAALVARRRRVG